MNRRTSLGGFASVCTLATSLVACSGTPDPGSVVAENVGSSAEALSGNDAVTRGALWVAAQVPYCQSPNGEADPDTSCASVCSRPQNAMWDPYRSDCSGFVSWAWNLPAPGRTTSEFAPAVNDITMAIDGSTMLPGDALNIPGDHIVMFVAWVVQGQSAVFYEEPGCSASPPYAHQFTSNVEINGSSVTIDYEGSTFTAIRYTGLSGTVSTGAPDAGTVGVDDAGTGCFVSTIGVSGECMLTSDCAALGNHISTPGYCPGADDIQCCTSTLMSVDSGMRPTEPDSDAGTTTQSKPDSSASPVPVKDSGIGADDAGDDGGPAWEEPPVKGSDSKGCSTAPGGAKGSGAEMWLAGLALVGLRRRKRQ